MRRRRNHILVFAFTCYRNITNLVTRSSFVALEKPPIASAIFPFVSVDTYLGPRPHVTRVIFAPLNFLFCSTLCRATGMRVGGRTRGWANSCSAFMRTLADTGQLIIDRKPCFQSSWSVSVTSQCRVSVHREVARLGNFSGTTRNIRIEELEFERKVACLRSRDLFTKPSCCASERIWQEITRGDSTNVEAAVSQPTLYSSRLRAGRRTAVDSPLQHRCMSA